MGCALIVTEGVMRFGLTRQTLACGGDAGFTLYGFLCALCLGLVLSQVVWRGILFFNSEFKGLQEKRTMVLSSLRWFHFLRYQLDKKGFSYGAKQVPVCLERSSLPPWLLRQANAGGDVLKLSNPKDTRYYFLHRDQEGAHWVWLGRLRRRHILSDGICSFRCLYRGFSPSLGKGHAGVFFMVSKTCASDGGLASFFLHVVSPHARSVMPHKDKM